MVASTWLWLCTVADCYVRGALSILGIRVTYSIYVPLTNANGNSLQEPMANASANLAQKPMSNANGMLLLCKHYDS
jgi:hypothetical protein